MIKVEYRVYLRFELAFPAESTIPKPRTIQEFLISALTFASWNYPDESPLTDLHNIEILKLISETKGTPPHA